MNGFRDASVAGAANRRARRSAKAAGGRLITSPSKDAEGEILANVTGKPGPAKAWKTGSVTQKNRPVSPHQSHCGDCVESRLLQCTQPLRLLK
ncbi:hypothetical protein RBWH47_02337 [Rhodopirellula baltica WH47]|uniref:Uncharacterized protein n=1 Tax=Rhodopirellula baltica WH47 TaxID=991778 RepID=F2ARR6_RHOBT|nr:hypothetical protein RBWH47_02337 [Rhodopirellula baltica WH47]